MKFRHLTYSDRLKLEALLRAGTGIKDIAGVLGFAPKSIYRELERGRYEHRNYDYTTEVRYSADLAESRYREHLKAKGPDLKIGSDMAFAEYVEYKICVEHYSPAAVLGEIKAKGLKFNTTVSKTTLYRYIDSGLFLTLTNADLPVKKRKKSRKHRIVRAKRAPQGMSIEKRPDDISGREAAGHWEMDCVVGKRGTKKTLLVLTERYSRLELVRLMPDKTAQSVVKALNGIEKKCGSRLFRNLFKSITVDNGSEFSDCDGMERSINGGKRTSVYYCHPYSAYERGSNENANKLIRRHYPKGMSFEKVTQKSMHRLQDWINNYPRKIFGYCCAKDVFEACFEGVEGLL